MTKTIAIVLAAAGGGVCWGGAPEVAVYDTGKSSGAPIEEAALVKREGWQKLPEGKGAGIKGDAVLVNGKLAAVLRQNAGAAEIYALGGDGAKLRAKLAPLVDGGGAATIQSLKATAVGAEECAVQAAVASGQITYTLSAVNPILKTRGGGPVIGQRMEAPARLGVMPDFFADDMVIDARAIPIERTEIPSENFFMCMLDNGNSIVTAIWDKNKRDVELSLSGEKDARLISGVDVFYGDGGGIWLAVLDQKGIWAQAEITSNNVKQVIALDWKAPFRAKWKGDFMRTDHTVDSWEFSYNSENRRGWSGVVGNYQHPCWFDSKDPTKGAIQAATQFPNGNFAGPFVAYAIERDKDTPLQQLTITDLMRNSLGVGPCANIMDVVGQGVTNRGVFTCAADAMVTAIFAGNRQKEERHFLDVMLKATQVFVKAIADRINAYVEFRGQILQYLGEQKKAKPELADFIGRIEAQATKIQATKVDRSGAVASLVAQIKKEALSDSPRPDISTLTSEGSGGIAAHGEYQDDTAAKCRNAVKILRQMATIEMAVNPKSAELSKEIRKRTQQMLRGSLGHEMR